MEMTVYLSANQFLLLDKTKHHLAIVYIHDLCRLLAFSLPGRAEAGQENGAVEDTGSTFPLCVRK